MAGSAVVTLYGWPWKSVRTRYTGLKWCPDGVPSHAQGLARSLQTDEGWKNRNNVKRSRTCCLFPDLVLSVPLRASVCDHRLGAPHLTKSGSPIRMSYGTGRPSILKDDESIYGCRLLLQHPLAIEDDMRLVSTVELMALRERVNNNLQPIDRPVDDHTFNVLREADNEFSSWYSTWDRAFSQKYENAGKFPI